MSPRWRKVFKDLWENKARTMLVVASIAVGVFAVGSVLNSYINFSHDMDADYALSKPHHGSLYSMPFDMAMVKTLEQLPGVETAQGFSSFSGQVEGILGNWVPIYVNALPKEQKMDKVFPLPGQELPYLAANEVLIEKTSLALMNVKKGDTIEVKLPDERIRRLKVAGVIHDVNAYSSVFSGGVTAYVSPGTMEKLTGTNEFTELRFRVDGDDLTELHVKEVAAAISQKLEKSGRMVFATVVIEPGQHPMRSTTQSLLALMGGLGGLAVFLSAFLVVNTISAVLARHTRQIGVMKAVGATTSQVIGMYVVLILAFGGLALLIAVPISALVAQLALVGMAGMLNFEAGGIRIPLPSLLLQLMVGLLLPLGASLVPVMKGARMTVREAISNYGIGAQAFGKSLIDRMVEKVSFLSRPLLISLRNTFRRKARLALTLSTLVLAGAIFIAVFNIRASFNFALKEALGYFLSDVNVALYDMAHIGQVEELMMQVPHIQKVEPWATMPARILSEDKSTATEIMVWGAPENSTLIQPTIVEGRWLVPGDQNALVIGNHVLQTRPELGVGDDVVLLINNREYHFTIVGIFRMAGTVIPPFTYASFDYLNITMDNPGRAAYYRVDLDTDGVKAEREAGEQISQVLGALDITVGDWTTGTENRAQQEQVTNILVGFLLFMAALIAIVGGLGLSGTMSMNVMERTREIGVMRSIGASNGAILFMVVFEGMLIGVISWGVGVVLAIPISKILCDTVGVAFLSMPMKTVLAADGMIIWLIVVIVLSAVASLAPAMSAARLTVRDVLAYE